MADLHEFLIKKRKSQYSTSQYALLLRLAELADRRGYIYETWDVILAPLVKQGHEKLTLMRTGHSLFDQRIIVSAMKSTESGRGQSGFYKGPRYSLCLGSVDSQVEDKFGRMKARGFIRRVIDLSAQDLELSNEKPQDVLNEIHRLAESALKHMTQRRIGALIGDELQKTA